MMVVNLLQWSWTVAEVRVLSVIVSMRHEARQSNDEHKRQLETDAATACIPAVDSQPPLHRPSHADETPTQTQTIYIQQFIE